MLLPTRTLSFNAVLLALLIGVPFLGLWIYLLSSGQISTGVLLAVIAMTLLDAALMYYFIRGLLQPLRCTSDILNRVAQGDFTSVAENPYQGDLGKMIDDVNSSVRSTREMMSTVLANTVNIASATFETVGASSHVVINAEEEERNARRITTSSAEINSAVAEIADNANHANEGAHAMRSAVQDGDAIVAQTLQSMNQLSGTVQDAAEKVTHLGEASQRIGEISSTIDAIAEQTNLLALNAAIEAARAGEQGRGFAVVADEVRSLAQRTSQATAEITVTIEEIQKAIGDAITTMHSGVEKADEGKEAAQQTSQAFAAISNNIGDLAELISAIATAAEQQRAATTAIAENIHTIADLSAANTSHAQMTVDRVEELSSVIGQQLRIIDQFDIPHKTILIAKSDHMMWKKRLSEMMMGRSGLRNDEVSDHHHCRFGKWYYTEGVAQYGHLETFRAIEEPHGEVHRIAKEAVTLFNSGRKQEAERLIDDLDTPTEEVLELLEKLREEAERM